MAKTKGSHIYRAPTDSRGRVIDSLIPMEGATLESLVWASEGKKKMGWDDEMPLFFRKMPGGYSDTGVKERKSPSAASQHGTLLLKASEEEHRTCVRD